MKNLKTFGLYVAVVLLTVLLGYLFSELNPDGVWFYTPPADESGEPAEPFWLGVLIGLFLEIMLFTILYLIKCAALGKHLEQQETKLWEKHGKPSLSFTIDSIQRSTRLLRFLTTKRYNSLESEKGKILGERAHQLFIVTCFLWFCLIVVLLLII